MTTLQYATATEARIARKIVKDALANGWSISVYDGEEWTLMRSAKQIEILEAMCSTDMDTLRFHDGYEAIGSVLLIWGNDEDIVSDYTDSDVMSNFMEGRY